MLLDDDGDLLRQNPLAVARAIAVALEQSRCEHGGALPETDEADLALAATPSVKVIFEAAASGGSPSVREVDSAEQFEAAVAAAAIREAQPPTTVQPKHATGFVFRRS